jgi:hypothetical protein
MMRRAGPTSTVWAEAAAMLEARREEVEVGERATHQEEATEGLASARLQLQLITFPQSRSLRKIAVRHIESTFLRR